MQVQDIDNNLEFAMLLQTGRDQNLLLFQKFYAKDWGRQIYEWNCWKFHDKGSAVSTSVQDRNVTIRYIKPI